MWKPYIKNGVFESRKLETPHVIDTIWLLPLFDQNLIATKPGVQRIAGMKVFDTREKKAYDYPLSDLEV